MSEESLKNYTKRMISSENKDDHDYLEYHRERFEYVFQISKKLKPDENTLVLDVGKSYLSELLNTHYRKVETIGFDLDEDEALISKGVKIKDSPDSDHIVYDLNNAVYGESIKSSKKYDLIVFAETIEHIHHAPEFALYALREILSDDGVILCQTPNAIALHKRILMLFGKNPFEKIRFDPFNPGHIREYTKNELIACGDLAGLSTSFHEYKDYFGYQGSKSRKLFIGFLKLICKIIPSFARGQTIAYKKPL